MASPSAPSPAMTPTMFRRLVAKAKREDPRCCYCGKNHARTAATGLMYMKRRKRIACRDCPETFRLEFNR